MGISWILFVAAVIILVQSQIYRKWGLSKIAYTRFFSVPAAVEGDPVEMIETIVNRKLLPITWLRLESMIPIGLKFQSQTNLDINSGEFHQNHKSIFSLLPYTRIIRKHSVICASRGCYQLTTASITCGDPLGLQAISESVNFKTQLLVYPKPVPLGEIPLPSHSWQGNVFVKRWIVEDPFMIAGVRDYIYGDPLNSINWKSTARVGKLQVHQRDYTADHRLLLFVNFENTELMWDAVTDPGMIELGISYAASIAQNTLSQGIETGFGCNGCLSAKTRDTVRVMPGSGSEQLSVILEVLAKLVIERSLPFDTFLEEEVALGTANSDILLITAFVSEKMERQINQLKRMGNAVEVVWLQPLNENGKEAVSSL